MHSCKVYQSLQEQANKDMKIKTDIMKVEIALSSLMYIIEHKPTKKEIYKRYNLHD